MARATKIQVCESLARVGTQVQGLMKVCQSAPSKSCQNVATSTTPVPGLGWALVWNASLSRSLSSTWLLQPNTFCCSSAATFSEIQSKVAPLLTVIYYLLTIPGGSGRWGEDSKNWTPSRLRSIDRAEVLIIFGLNKVKQTFERHSYSSHFTFKM